MQSVHKYRLSCLIISFAVALQAVHVRNISKVQIKIQIYAFNSNLNSEITFNLLKIILHPCHLVKQMQSLCQDIVDICNVFSVFFLSLLSLTSVILHYCNVVVS